MAGEKARIQGKRKVQDEAFRAVQSLVKMRKRNQRRKQASGQVNRWGRVRRRTVLGFQGTRTEKPGGL